MDISTTVAIKDLYRGPMPAPKKGMVALVLLRQANWVVATVEFGRWGFMSFGGRTIIYPTWVSGWVLLEEL